MIPLLVYAAMNYAGSSSAGLFSSCKTDLRIGGHGMDAGKILTRPQITGSGLWEVMQDGWEVATRGLCLQQHVLFRCPTLCHRV